jgi:cytochrome bd-type quinol oxidase subunit 2
MRTPPSRSTLLLRGGTGALLALALPAALGMMGVFSVGAGPAQPAHSATPRAQSAPPTGASAEVFRSGYIPWLIFILVVFVLLVALLLWITLTRNQKHRRLDPHNLWTLSIAFSILCALAILAIWIVLVVAPFPQGSGAPLLSQGDLDRYLAARPTEASTQPRILVPTGVFVQSIEFTSAFDPIISGFIWQKYGPQVPADVTRGFVLPDGSDLQSAEAYRFTQGDTQVIGWSFRATLRQQFLYSQYPFDRHYIWVRVDPVDVTHNVVLTPDFSSYTTLQPEALPGVQPELVIENWDLKQAFFSYHTHSYNTNLGIEDYTHQINYPELYYTIGMSRQILSSFVSYVVPPLVALVMLFGVLVLTTRRQDRRDSTGWNSTNVLAFCAALFFVIIVSHVNLRQQVSANGILYLGYFYFLTYFAILLVSVNAILFILPGERGLIQRDDNLLSKLLYWPLLTFALLIITLAVFL